MFFYPFLLFDLTLLKMIALITYGASLVDYNYLMSRMSSPYYYRHNHHCVMSSSTISLSGWYVIRVNDIGRESDSYSRNCTTNKDH